MDGFLMYDKLFPNNLSTHIKTCYAHMDGYQNCLGTHGWTPNKVKDSRSRHWRHRDSRSCPGFTPILIIESCFQTRQFLNVSRSPVPFSLQSIGNLEILLRSQKMEDDLKFVRNGRRPQFFGKWKTTSIFGEMEDDLNCFENLIFWENRSFLMKDNIKKVIQPKTIKI